MEHLEGTGLEDHTCWVASAEDLVRHVHLVEGGNHLGIDLDDHLEQEWAYQLEEGKPYRVQLVG